MKILILYTTAGCHLCEQAAELVDEVLPADGSWTLQPQDIAESEPLVEAYGLRIPVLRRPDTGEELGWPFDERDVRGFLAA